MVGETQANSIPSVSVSQGAHVNLASLSSDAKSGGKSDAELNIANAKTTLTVSGTLRDFATITVAAGAKATFADMVGDGSLSVSQGADCVVRNVYNLTSFFVDGASKLEIDGDHIAAGSTGKVVDGRVIVNKAEAQSEHALAAAFDAATWRSLFAADIAPMSAPLAAGMSAGGGAPATEGALLSAPGPWSAIAG